MLCIVLGKDDPLTLNFKLRDTPVAQLWAQRMHQRHAWPLDHPDRFYGFGSEQQEQDRAVKMIQQCIATINNHDPIIHRAFEYTQDCLNYLHNIFEQHHGLLDQQTSKYWQRAPVTVRKALAELNLAVHRCESVMRQCQPRFVCTWFGMPKTHCLDPVLQSAYGEPKITFGTVYLNYCEIGKTVENLTSDNDEYIGDDAFKPFSHYSADFNVQFADQDLTKTYDRIQQYIENHSDFFLAHDITSVYNINAQPLRFPVADLIYNGNREDLIKEISQRQWIHEVRLE